MLAFLKKICFNMTMNNKLKKTILLTGDIAILYLALWLTLAIRYFGQSSAVDWNVHLGPFSFIFIFWIIIFYISDLYNLHLAVNNARFLQITSKSVLFAGLLSAAFFYLDPHIGIAPKTNLIIYVVTFYFLFLLWRRIYNWVLKAYLPKNNIAIIGVNDQVQELLNILRTNQHLGYNVKLVIDNDGFDISNGQNIKNNIITDLKSTIASNKITTLVLASDPHQSSELRSNLFACLPLDLNITSMSNFYETVTGRVPIEAINQMWFLENLSKGDKSYFNAIKRTMDIFLALVILIITAIFWPLIGLVIKIQSPGPIFFKQTRTGKNSRPFMMIKFRTMTEDGNDRNPTTINDRRITVFGSFLRKTRIDEIPQVINVLVGDMSFVGPRAERPELIAQLEQDIPFYRERMLIKPGLTGWDQVSGEYHSPSRTDTLKKLQYDLFYIKNRSLYLDLSIILKTIATVLSRSGV